jgi:hypothetical protein
MLAYQRMQHPRPGRAEEVLPPPLNVPSGLPMSVPLWNPQPGTPRNCGKPWENHGKTMGKPWTTMGKPWKNTWNHIGTLAILANAGHSNASRDADHWCALPAKLHQPLQTASDEVNIGIPNQPLASRLCIWYCSSVRWGRPLRHKRTLVALVESGLKSPCDTWSYSPFCCNVIYIYYYVKRYVCVMNIPTQPRRSIFLGTLRKRTVAPCHSQHFWGGAACPETGDPKCTGLDPPNSPKWLLVDICPAAQQDIQGLELASK